MHAPTRRRALALAPSVLVAALLAAPASAQSTIRSLPGATGDRLGSAICDAGDVNGDGWNDYLVGEPGRNGGRGAVSWVSGKFLATNLGPSELFSCQPTATQVSADAAFGWAIAKAGDVTGDNVADFFVGAPFDDKLNKVDSGTAFMVNGATHAISTFFYQGSTGVRLGWSLSPTGDLDGDSRADVLVGCPAGTGSGQAYLLSGRLFVQGLLPGDATALNPSIGWQAGHQFGYAVLATADFDGDGLRDFAVTAPLADYGTADHGVVRVFSGAAGHAILLDYWGQPGQQFGLALASGADFDGDGRQDLAVGTGRSSSGALHGEVILLSPQHILSGTPPFEVFAWDGPVQSAPGSQFGASVAVAGDLNGDGLPELLVGAPNYAQAPAGSHGNYGAVGIYSGRTGARVGWYTAGDNQRLGSAVLGCVDDLDGDGRLDFVVGGTNASAPTSACGVLKAARLFPSLPTTYCLGKVNSLGCTPAVTVSGSASATSPSPFLIGAVNVINKNNGLLFYGFAPNAVPFQGGLMCVAAPTIRMSMQGSGGSATGSDCTGTFSCDFNARIQGGNVPNLGVGAEVFCQYWSRDPASPSTTSLSDALRFLVNP